MFLPKGEVPAGRPYWCTRLLLRWVKANCVTLKISARLDSFFHHLVCTKEPSAAVSGYHVTGWRGLDLGSTEKKAFVQWLRIVLSVKPDWICALVEMLGPRQNVGHFVPDYIASHPRRQTSLCIPFFRVFCFPVLYCAVRIPKPTQWHRQGPCRPHGAVFVWIRVAPKIYKILKLLVGCFGRDSVLTKLVYWTPVTRSETSLIIVGVSQTDYLRHWTYLHLC